MRCVRARPEIPGPAEIARDRRRIEPELASERRHPRGVGISSPSMVRARSLEPQEDDEARREQADRKRQEGRQGVAASTVE